jgi:hypothetical protein
MPFAPGGTPGPMYNPYAFMTPPPWFMPPMQGSSATYPSTPIPQSSTHHAILSSDPPDDIGANPYPEIRLFFAQLDEKYSRRNLSKYADEFEVKDFYHIDEITRISIDRLSSAEFGISAGNAQFIVEASKAEMKRVDRALGKKRR